MALRCLIHGLEKLTIGGSLSRSAFCSTNINNRLAFHTSAFLERHLNSHIVPTFKLPSNRNKLWEPRKKFSELYEYTVKPLPFPQTGGRGPNGRIWNFRRGGRHKRKFRMIDWIRGGPKQGPPMVEKVDKILYDPNRSARIALVANGERKRYVIATTNMKAGDHIKSSRVMDSTSLVRAEDGNSYPVGSLPVGTLINNLELYPDGGALVARAAGTTAQIIRKSEDKCIIKLPSKRFISVELHCVATVGRVSNEDHDKRVIGKAGRNRWLGIRPKSGLWKRKTGRFGRKIKPAKPVKAYGNTRKIKVERETRYLDIQRPYGHHQTLTTSGNYINNKEYYIPYGGQNLSRRLK